MMVNDSARESTQVEVSSQEAQLSSGALAVSGNTGFNAIMKNLFEGNQVDVETMMRVISNLPGSMDIRNLKERVTDILKEDGIEKAIDLIVELRNNEGLNSLILQIISYQFANHFRNVEGEFKLSDICKAKFPNIGGDDPVHIGEKFFTSGLKISRIQIMHDMYQEFIVQFFKNGRDFEDTDVYQMFYGLCQYPDKPITPVNLEETVSKNKAALKKYVNSLLSNAVKSHKRYLPMLRKAHDMESNGINKNDIIAMMLGYMLKDDRNFYSINHYSQDLFQLTEINDEGLLGPVREIIDAMDEDKKEFFKKYADKDAVAVNAQFLMKFSSALSELVQLSTRKTFEEMKYFVEPIFGCVKNQSVKSIMEEQSQAGRWHLPEEPFQGSIEEYKKIGYSYLLDKLSLWQRIFKFEDVDQMSPMLIALGGKQVYLIFRSVYEFKNISETLEFICKLKTGFNFVDERVKEIYIRTLLDGIFLEDVDYSSIKNDDYSSWLKQIKFCLEYKDIDLAIETIIKLRRQSNDGNEMASILEEYCSDKFYNCFGDKSQFNWYVLRGAICKHLFGNPSYDTNYFMNGEKIFKEDLKFSQYKTLNIYPSEVEGFVREFFIEKRSIEDTDVAKRFLNLSVNEDADSSERNKSGLKITARVLFNELKYIIENYLLIIRDGSLDYILGTLRNEFDDPEFIIKLHTIASFFCADAYSDVVKPVINTDYKEPPDSARQNEIFSDFTIDEKLLILDEDFQEMVKKTAFFLKDIMTSYVNCFNMGRKKAFTASELDDPRTMIETASEKGKDVLKTCIDNCRGNAAFEKVFKLKPLISTYAARKAKKSTENHISPADFNEMKSEEFLSYIGFYLSNVEVNYLKKILEGYDFISIINLNKCFLDHFTFIANEINNYIVWYFKNNAGENLNALEKSTKELADYFMSIGDDELSQKVRGFTYYINEKSMENLVRFCAGKDELEDFDALSPYIEPLLEKLRSGESPNFKHYEGILISLSSEKFYSDFCDIYEEKDLYCSLNLMNRLNSDEEVDERARCIYSLYLQNLFSETPNTYIMKDTTKTELSNLEMDYEQIERKLDKILANGVYGDLFEKFKRSIDNEDVILAIKVIRELREKSEGTGDRQLKWRQVLTLLSQEYYRHFKATYKDIVSYLNDGIKFYFGRKYYNFLNDNVGGAQVGDKVVYNHINHKRSILSPEIFERFIDEFFLEGKDIESTVAGSIFSAVFAGLEYCSDYEKNAASDEILELEKEAKSKPHQLLAKNKRFTEITQLPRNKRVLKRKPSKTQSKAKESSQLSRASDTEKIDFLKHFYPERYANPKNVEETKKYNLYGNAMYARSLLDMAEDFLGKYSGIFYASISMNMDIYMLIGFLSTEPDIEYMNNYQQDLANFCDIERYKEAGMSDEESKQLRDIVTTFFSEKEKKLFFDSNVLDLLNVMSSLGNLCKQLFGQYANPETDDFSFYSKKNMIHETIEFHLNPLLETCLKIPNFKEVIKFQKFDPKSPEATVAKMLGEKILNNRDEALKLFNKAKEGKDIPLDEIIETVGFLLNTIKLKLLKNAIENNNIESAVRFLQILKLGNTESLFKLIFKNHFKKISHTEGVINSLLSFFMSNVIDYREMHMGNFVLDSIVNNGSLLISRTAFTTEMIDEFIEEFFTNGSLKATKLYNLINGLSLGEEYFNSQGAMSSEEIKRVDEDKVKNPVKYKSAKPKTYEETKAANLDAVINYIKYLMNAAKFFLTEYFDLLTNEPNFEVVLGKAIKNKDGKSLVSFQQDLLFFSQVFNSPKCPDDFKNQVVATISEEDIELFFGGSERIKKFAMQSITALFNVLSHLERPDSIVTHAALFLEVANDLPISFPGFKEHVENHLKVNKYSNSERNKLEKEGRQFLKANGVLEDVDSQLGIPEAKEAIYSDLFETSNFVKKHGYRPDEACFKFISKRMGGDLLSKEIKLKYYSADNVTDVRQAIQKIMDSLGNGAIIIFTVQLGRLGGLHSFVAEQFHGEALFLDPVTGKKVSDKYLGKARFLVSALLSPDHEESATSSTASSVEEFSRSASPVHEESATLSPAVSP